MENNEISGVPVHDVVVSPDDPDYPNDPVLSTYCVERKIVPRRKRIPQVKFKHEKHQPNDTRIVIQQLENILGKDTLKNIHERPVRQFCINKVPKDLRNIDIKAYAPLVISIGPFHNGEQALSEMESQKLRYMLEFGKRVGPEKVKDFKRFLEEKEQMIRNSYQENSSLGSPEFVKMILRDAVFIVEFFLKNVEPVKKRKFDFFLDTPYVRAVITRDLQLLENQLPYFLLQNLFVKAAFVKGAFHNFTKKDYPHHDPFLILSLRFFFNSKNEVFPKPKNRIQHFTDMIRYFLLMDQKQGDSPTETKLERVRDLPTATKLHGSGVKFKMGNKGGSSLEISCKYVPRAMRIPGFKGREIQIPFIKELELRIPGFKGREIQIPFIKELELQIPRFEIDDWSECLYRNLMALELCHYPYDTHICNFILLMNSLIDKEKDVDLLVDQKIIFSCLGDNNTVATMFNNLGLQITPSHSVYHDICEKLKKHNEKSWNRTKTTLISVYFKDLWTGTATLAAFILLVLTFIQAVYSIL